MRVDEEGEALGPESEENVSEGAVTEKTDQETALEELPPYDPSDDKLGDWLALFMCRDFAMKDPDLSVYARVLSRMRLQKVTNPHACPMMAVTIRRGRYILMYNPQWARTATFIEVVATLAHEAFHILALDIPRFLRRMALFPENERASMHRLLNVALDAANNSLLVDKMRHMRYGSTGYWVLPEALHLPDKLNAESYFEILLQERDELMEQLEEMMKNGDLVLPMPGGEGGDGDEDGADGGGGDGADEEGDGNEDGTGGGGEGNEEVDEEGGKGGGEGQGSKGGYSPIAEAMAHLMQKNAHDWLQGEVEQASPEELDAMAANLEAKGVQMMVGALQEHKKSVGNLPAHLQAKLDALLEEAIVPWTDIFRRMVQARMLSSRKATMNRPHKRKYVLFYKDEDGNIQRFDSPHPSYPGMKRDRTYIIVFAIDTSGSMSDEEVVEGLSEVQGILKDAPDAHCLVVQCDTNISAVDVLGPEMDVEEYVESIGRTSGGGTTFYEPFKLTRFIQGMDEPPDLPEGALQKIADYKHIDLVVYHTDTYGAAPRRDLHPGCPTIWTVSSRGNEDFQPHFGQVITRA